MHDMRKFAITLALALCLAIGLPLAAQSPEHIARRLQDYRKKEVMLSMRDGTRLYTAVYEPASAPTLGPLLVMRTPYACEPYGQGFTSLLRTSLAAYVECGYTLVFLRFVVIFNKLPGIVPAFFYYLPMPALAVVTYLDRLAER